MSLNQLNQLVCERCSYHPRTASVPLALALIATLASLAMGGATVSASDSNYSPHAGTDLTVDGRRGQLLRAVLDVGAARKPVTGAITTASPTYSRLNYCGRQ